MVSKFEFLVVLSLAALIGNDAYVVSSVEVAEKLCPAIVDCTVHGELLPNPEDCSSYCHCDWGVAKWRPCSSGLHFNNKLKVCDWPQNANCQVTTPEPTTTTRRTTTRRTTTRRTRPTTTTTTTTTTTEPPTTEPPTEEPETTEPPTEAPTEEPTEAPTEAPTEEPTEAPTEAPTEPPTTEAPEVPAFDCTDKDCGYYPVSNSVNDYVQCSGGVGVVHTCPNSLEFDPAHSTCNLPASTSSEEEF